MLDINKVREDRGGEPDLLRESQAMRGLDPATVDACIEADGEWLSGALTTAVASLCSRLDVSCGREFDVSTCGISFGATRT